MAERLTAVKVASKLPQGRYGDGRGLCLLVKAGGSKSWVLRIQINGKRRDIGLGSAHDFSLAEARAKAEDLRHKYVNGAEFVSGRNKPTPPKIDDPTFSAVAYLYHAEHEPSWKNKKHAEQVISTLKTYAFPKIGQMKVSEVSSSDIHQALIPIWLVKPETARRVLQRIFSVLNYAQAKEWRTEGISRPVLIAGFPKQSDSERHYPALQWERIPDFMLELRTSKSTSRVLLDFTILTAVRSSESRSAAWSEFEGLDSPEPIWRIPGERMKKKREHVVPLSKPAAAIVVRMKEISRDKKLVFPGTKPGKPLSDMTMTSHLRKAGWKDERGELITTHGFRSTFRDWVADETDFPKELADAALAHLIKDATEAAYNRTTMLRKRRKLMEAWADYCDGILVGSHHTEKAPQYAG